MRIAIDLDDTLVNTSERTMEYLKEIDSKYMDNIQDIMRDNLTNPIVVEFYDKYLSEIVHSAKLKENALLINELYKDYEIYFITARSERFIKDVDTRTKNLLDSFNIKYHKVITGAGNKAEVCYENKIDLLIDDSIRHCTKFRELGGKSFLMNSPLNKDIETDLKRVYNWKEIYDIINS